MYLLVKTESGKEERVSAREGATLMELIRGAGFDELLALCGGCCSCATCHVYVDESDLKRLAPIGDDENELLDASQYRKANSRLSCQIPFTADLAGLTVTIAPEE